MRYAYFGIPHTGGTYTVYRYLRAGLQQHGIQVNWVGLGQQAHAVASDPQWEHERSNGKVVGIGCTTERELAEAFAKYLVEENFDGIFINVLADRVQTNIARYLPDHIRRVMIVHTITPATYAAARSVRDFVHATVCVSPRIREDLVGRFGFTPKRTFCIQNGIDLGTFQTLVRSERAAGCPLRLVFLGRIEDTAKGIFWLPKILSHLDGIDYQLTVAGDGPDLEKLKSRCRPFGDLVVFIGKVASDEVPALLASQDVMLFPSRFEGLPLTLVEAQAAGCVPVASRIRGVTDFVVKDGETGWLFSMGDCRQAATYIQILAKDRALLQRMAAQAQYAVEGRFSLTAMAQDYSKVLEAARQLRLPTEPLPLAEWSVPRGMKAGFRTALPSPVKNFLRVIKERVAR